ncbi:hypothetical protein QFC20_001371 [Naganishia adeliensis]|uniref:Uncharacterized protein n=1 Tax=Naganishia adeliensis TaxID=92952 RepID=A0ACC2WSS7_9TREE|nr:hypothetical protein QFC20_001371 [Naganishia adeliensis]
MLGLSGKESERDDRFSETLPLSVEKADTEATDEPGPAQEEFYYQVPRALSQTPRAIKVCALSIKASLAEDGMDPENMVGLALPMKSKTSLPLYLQPFQALELSWDQGVKGALSIQEDDTDLRQAYIVLQTSDDAEFKESSFVKAFATSDRLSIRFKASEGVDAAEKTYNAILRVPASSEAMPPITVRGAEATLNIPESMGEAMFPFLEIDSLLSGFKADNLHVGLLRVSSGTGDISGTFNVSRELDLKTSTGNITAKVNLHAPSFPHPPHDKPGKHHKHPKHGPRTPGHGPRDEAPPSPPGRRWFWQSSEQDVEAADLYTDDDVTDQATVDLGEERPPPGEHRPGPPGDHHRRLPPPPDHERHPPFPPHKGGRRPPFPPGPDYHHHRPGHPPSLVQIHAVSSTGNVHLTYLNHLEKAALISTVYSDTGKIDVKLAEDYKAGVKVGQVVLANERDKTLIIDREVKTPTGAFVEGFVKSGNDTEGPGMSKAVQAEGDERLAVEREFDFARMTSQGPPPSFPHGPDHPPPRGGRHGPHRGPHGPIPGSAPGPPHGRPGSPHGPPHRHPPFHPPPPPPPGFGFSAAFSTVGEVKLVI